MTSQGTRHGHFQRAIRDRHLRRASMAARELGTVSLADALALTLLTAEVNGWRAYLDTDDELVFYCPECAEREFKDS